MPYLERDGDVHVLYLGDRGVELSESNPENRLTPEWLPEFSALLDQLEAETEKRALVITATGKFFHNGLDVAQLLTPPDEAGAYLLRVHGVFARVLTLGLPTIAAINGHAFGAGAMLALSTDFRVMREDRGFFCLPEISLGMPFPPGMNALVRGRLPIQTAVEAMTTGRRYGGADAAAAGIVGAALGPDELLERAVSTVAPLTVNAGKNLSNIKTELFAPILEQLYAPVNATDLLPR